MNSISKAVRVEQIGNATLYLGDCRDVLPMLSGVDAVVADPPFGINFRGKKTADTPRIDRDTYPDDDVTFMDIVLPAVRSCLALFPRALIFCGIPRLHDYPKPRDIGGIFIPTSTLFSPWGFCGFIPAMLYGESPYQQNAMGARATTKVVHFPGFHVTGEARGNDHPCPKPIAFMDWAVTTASLTDEVVLDPFMGSGTTGVACHRQGRRFVGIEVVPHYFDIACRRIEEAQRQRDMFLTPPESMGKTEGLI